MRATIRREFHEWSRGAIQAQYDSQIWPRIIDRYHATRRFIDETRVAMERRYTEDELHSSCVSLAPPRFDPLALTCRVSDATGVGPGVVVQRQRWTGPEGDGAGQTRPAIAMLGAVESTAPNAVMAYRLLGWAAEEHGYLLEPYFVDGDGKDFIVIPYQHGGSSGGGHFYLLHRTERTADWHEIDARTWHSGVAERLPRNMLPKDAYDIDLLNMTATISLFRRDLPYDNFRDDGRVEIGLVL